MTESTDPPPARASARNEARTQAQAPALVPAGVSEAAAVAAGETWVTLGRLRRRLQALHAPDGVTDGAADLSAAQASVMIRLVKQGPATAGELAAAEGVRPQSVAATVLALEAAGLVRRDPDPRDGRRRVVSVTELGHETWRGELRARRAWLARALQEHGTEEEIRAVSTAMALLDRITTS
ncbi:MarR family winged helix-turn-helix transcriptional regulator (plasmid) [Streptomyces sp. BI20]|uniref:MarR family winged helix-turn-helix transcriptional regulator n=1 Tax=Streptomyces sp. BI20 TaxID=3403460 RepID=UPI003C746D44